MAAAEAAIKEQLWSFEISPEVRERHQLLVSSFSQQIHFQLGRKIQQFYQQILALVQSKYHSDGSWEISIGQDIAALASGVKQWLNSQPGKLGNEAMSFLTKLTYSSHICRLLNSLAQATAKETYFIQLSSCIEIFQQLLKMQMQPEAARKKGLQKRRLAQRRKHKETLSFKPLHEYAVSVLSNLESQKDTDWRKVSVALAIATGRRLAEIHLAASRFEYVDARHVKFTGQRKLMGDAAAYFEQNPSYIMPVLVDAEKVVKAHQWLKQKGQVVESPQAVNRAFGNRLRQWVRHLKQKWGILHPLFTYKAFRSIYASACNQVFNSKDMGNNLYIADILGLGRGGLLKWGLITDTQTPQSYISDFRLLETECVLQPNREKRDAALPSAESDRTAPPSISIQDGCARGEPKAIPLTAPYALAPDSISIQEEKIEREIPAHACTRGRGVDI